jgi:hypothetical protein
VFGDSEWNDSAITAAIVVGVGGSVQGLLLIAAGRVVRYLRSMSTLLARAVLES